MSLLDFDIIGFSVHDEHDLKNVLWILEKGGIQLYSEKRRELLLKNGYRYPLIIGGGHVITSNPLLLNEMFDIFFIGDCESNLDEFLTKFLNYKADKMDFDTFLKEVTSINGIYVPSLNNEVKRAILENLDQSPNPIFQLISKSEKEKKIFEENFLLEINRGCPFKCKFCISSYHNSPFRNKSYESILETIKKAIKHSHFEKLSLIGSCVSSHPNFYEICEFIISQGKKLSIPSIRIDHITPRVIAILEKANIKSITIAPEAATESLRYSLGKKISNKKIFEVLNLIKNSKIRNVKFYFLIGLPEETDEDINQIIKLLRKISDLGFQPNSLKVNINPFIPKFNTPYENEVKFFLIKNLKLMITKYQKIERELKNVRSIKLKFQNPKEIIKKARIQIILSLGDKDISELLVRYYAYGATSGAMRRAEKDLTLPIDDYLLRIQSGYKPWNIKI
ncbi:MAG: B12-binding domain-containing radical SAM protein [Promethearchaeota archaeon]